MNETQMKELHQQLAIDLFNKSWDLLLKENRNPQDEEFLLDTAHASLYHWRQVGEPINFLRGQWMLTHIYTLLSHPEEAMYHANITLNLAIDLQVTDWDLAYAYSAMARANALKGDQVEFLKWYEMAQTAGAEIKEAGDKEQFWADFKDENWFGML